MDINDKINGETSEIAAPVSGMENTISNDGNQQNRRRRHGGRNQRRRHKSDQSSRDNAIEIVIGSENISYDDREYDGDDEPISCPTDVDAEFDDSDISSTDTETESEEEFEIISDAEISEKKTDDNDVKYEIIGVNFKKSGKIYYFDTCGGTYSKDDHVIVETARGLEYGTVILPNKIVSGSEVVLPLRGVVRFATEEDELHHRENKKKEIEAYNACVEKIAEHALDMKLVDVEYTFDNSKLIFYFTAEGRVDFRDLVKDLAAVFRTRIELRQIGIRDEAKLMGGLGICGRPFCCHSFLSDFVQVSIKMAKEQNLSLNSSKISGACGRLMCCLRYEYDVYSEEIKKTPKVDSVVETADGEGIVKETLPLAGLVKVEIHNKQDVTLKVFNRDEVTVVKGKTAKELIQSRQNKNDEGDAKEAKSVRSEKNEKKDNRRIRADKNDKQNASDGNESEFKAKPASSPEHIVETVNAEGAEKTEKTTEGGERRGSRGGRGNRGRGRRRGRGHSGADKVVKNDSSASGENGEKS